jgi:hypothetical protein
MQWLMPTFDPFLPLRGLSDRLESVSKVDAVDDHALFVFNVDPNVSGGRTHLLV